MSYDIAVELCKLSNESERSAYLVQSRERCNYVFSDM